MAEPKTDENFSIEEILESIRQIISEDGDAPAVDTAAAEPVARAEEKPQPKPVDITPPPASAPSFSAALQQANTTPAADDVFDLTEKVEEDITFDAAPQPAPQIDLQEVDDMNEPVDAAPAPQQPAAVNTASLLSEEASTAATAALSKLLSSNVAVNRDDASRVGSVTLEDIAREQMAPLIKTWLDQNLPRIIEGIVAKELDKIARRAHGE